MKILKFGGSSVGTPESITNVKHIVEATPQPVVVVVSALGGVTDQLIRMTHMAAGGDAGYLNELEALVNRHADMVGSVIAPDKQPALNRRLEELLA